MTQKKKTESKEPKGAQMTNQELIDLKTAIDKVKKSGSNKFKLAIMDNEDLVEPEVRKLNELQEPSADFQKYQEEYKQLLMKHVEIDQQTGALALYSQPYGQGVRVSNPGPNSYFNIINDEAGWKKAIQQLQEKYKDTISEREKQMNEFNKTLQQPAKKLNFVKVSRASVPDNIAVEYEELRVFRKWIIN